MHRVDCTNAAQLTANPERLIDVEWAPSSASVFLVQLQVEALDRNRLLSDVTRVLSDQHVNILSASVQTSRDRVAISRFTFEMGDPAHLDHVIKAVRRIDGVIEDVGATVTSFDLDRGVVLMEALYTRSGGRICGYRATATGAIPAENPC